MDEDNRPPDRMSEGDEALHRETVASQAEHRNEELRRRPEEVRLDMMRSVITEPLLSRVQKAIAEGRTKAKFDVIISLNELFSGGIPAALAEVEKVAADWNVRTASVSHYVFACVTAEQLLVLARATREANAVDRRTAVVYRIWEDTDIDVTLTQSLTTIKADAAQRSFQAHGAGIVWAVLDSGVQTSHAHFHPKEPPYGPFEVTEVSAPVEHMDFTPDARVDGPKPEVDRFGHGTHVAGIISGYWKSEQPEGEAVAGTEMRSEENNEPVRRLEVVKSISGVAPRCRLVSMKVIADVTLTGDARQTAGQGKVSWVLMALDQIQKWNQNGRRLLIHGVNMSLGYDFDPRWFACGQSPICVEANRLVKSGVCVVVSAGNSGYSSFVLASGRSEARFNDLTITDPGNAEYAITVGSTHKEMPHTYGVSYFSSRGPTGDGRMKPDLLAPGERIISCAAGLEAKKYGDAALYCEQSGTSMAAPHVSGAIAAFLSVRREFIGQPERVKEIFMENCIDLRRERSFQGAGLVDLMKVLQAV